MRIDYNILWFENEQTAYETKRDFVKDILEEFSFNFPEPRHEVDGANIDSIDYSKYDLIIADMNLDGNNKSMKLIDQIRNNQVLTEVLFYSSAGEEALRAELAKYRIDGAYCSGREDFEFEDKVRSVIETLIKKTQDLTNLRGLVMSEVSELDNLMEEIILEYYSKKDCASEAWIKFQNKILKKVEKSTKDKLIPKVEEIEENGKIQKKELCSKDCTHIWYNATSIVEINSSFEFDSSKKAHTIHEIIDQIDASKHFKFADYDKEIIQVRNDLAHSKSEIKDGKEILVSKKFGEVPFTQERFTEIRKNIKKYHDLFCELQEKQLGEKL